MNQPVGTARVQNINDRQEHRVAVSWRARLVLGPSLFEDAKVINISEGGMGLAVERPFAAGVRLDVAIAIPTEADRSRVHFAQVPCRVAFHVMANRQFRIGVQFLSVDAATKELIQHWLNH